MLLQEVPLLEGEQNGSDDCSSSRPPFKKTLEQLASERREKIARLKAKKQTENRLKVCMMNCVQTC